MTPEDLGDGPILLDTNVFSFAYTGRDPASWYGPFLAGRLWLLSFATVGELRHGALKAGWGTGKRTALERRIGLCVVVPGTDTVAASWARLARQYDGQLGRNGNDLWIAACALAQDPIVPIATHDSVLARIGAASGIRIVRAP